jgi:RNA polymerase sigma factor for flagellar operon FliA
MDPKRRIARIFGWYKRRPSTQLRNEIVNYYIHLVHREAQRVHRRLPLSVERGDLESDGVFGLLEAIDGYDPARSQFTTFASRRIKGAILDGLRLRDPVSRTARRKIRTLEQAADRLRAQTGMNPTPHELARAMDVPLAAYSRTASAARQSITHSLSGHRVHDANTPSAFSADNLPDPREPDPAKLLARKMVKDLITTGLSRSERLIVILYYYEGMRMKEIGTTLEICESRVSQMHSSILARLKARLTEAQLIG